MQRRQFTWKDYTISYLEEGEGKPLVFLHAFPFNALMWEPQVTRLAKHYHVLAPDIPSFGYSRPTPDILTMELAAQVLKGLIDHLHLDTIALVGLSMGGYMALAFADLFPEHLATLILADTHAGADAPEKKEQRLQFIEEIRASGTHLLFQRFLLSTLGKTTRSSHPALVEQVHHLMTMASPETIISALRGMAQRPSRFHVLSKLPCPVGILVGEEDFLTPLSDAESMQTLSSHASLIVIPHAGHMSNLENPAFFNTSIQKFLTP